MSLEVHSYAANRKLSLGNFRPRHQHVHGHIPVPDLCRCLVTTITQHPTIACNQFVVYERYLQATCGRIAHVVILQYSVDSFYVSRNMHSKNFPFQTDSITALRHFLFFMGVSSVVLAVKFSRNSSNC